MSDRLLERFHRALIEEIQTQRPEYLTEPFTVAEIYQNLVPYGSHRDRIGVEMNGDYEDALIRLLAGEGGYLILDSEPALRDLRAELEATNPNTSLYREFAAVDVRLNQAYLDLSAPALEELPNLVRELEAEDPVTMAELAPGEGAVLPGILPPGAEIFADPAVEEGAGVGNGAKRTAQPRQPLAPEFVETATEEAATEPRVVEARVGRPRVESCPSCGADVPERPIVNYCPFCGSDLRFLPCTECGTEIEPGWKYCIACGSAASV